MIILAGTIRIGAGKREAALAPMREMVAATSAEPGCMHYSFAFDLHDGHLVHIFEVFTDATALAMHRSSAHMTKWRGQAAELGLRDRDMAEYQVSDWQKI